MIFLVAGCSTNRSGNSTGESLPNIVLIVVDDLGYKDLHCYGNNLVETPNVDRLAREGIRFVNAYASCPVCSPTRAAILTGKNPVTVDITDWIPGHQAIRGPQPDQKFIVPEFNLHLPLEEITLAERLKEAGYQTASIGKWHLGGDGYLPTDQGFDLNVAGNDRGRPPSYYYPYTSDKKNSGFTITPLELTGDSLYLTDRLTNEAIGYMEKRDEGPFFLYLPFYTVHTPLEGRKDLVKKYEKVIAASNEPIVRNPHFLAMVECMDENVGRLLETLDRLEITRETMVIFVSDNGGLQIRGKRKNNEYNHLWASWNYPLRAGKGTLYEGGLRVPAIVKWPGKIEAGRVSEELIISTDFFPTLMEVTGLSAGDGLEGVSLVPHMRNREPVKRETFHWHYPHYHKTKPGSVIREGGFKLIKYWEDERVELYNLATDIGEEHNLADSLPGKALEMEQSLMQWLENEGAGMPVPNPGYRGD